MPTFDFSNILSKIVRTALNAVANPFTIITTASAAITMAVTHWISTFDIDLPSIDFDSSAFSEWIGDDWMDLVAYTIDYNTIKELGNFVIFLAASILPALITFIISCIGLYWTYKTYMTLRASLKDLG